MKSKKIAFFTPTLHGGGAERMMVDIANEFLLSGYEVDLLFVTSKGADLMPLIRPGINLVNFSSGKMQFVIPRLISYLRKSNPHAIISTQFHANLALAFSSLLANYKGEVIYRLCNMMTTYWRGNSKYRNLKGWLLIKLLMPFTFKRASVIVAQTQAMKEEVITDYSASLDKIKIIPNFIDQQRIDDLAIEEVDHEWLNDREKGVPIVLSAGRLDLQKDWNTLLLAFEKLQSKIKTKLIIIGDGPDRKKIESHIKESSLENTISLAGFQLNPFCWISKADLLVLSTFGEGFPNVVIQALACDCPVVSTDVPSAPREILENGKWGKLSKIQDINSLSDCMFESLSSQSSLNLKDRAQKYSKDKVIVEWYKVIEGN